MFTKRASVLSILAISFVALMMFSFVSAVSSSDGSTSSSIGGKILNVILGDYRGGLDISNPMQMMIAKILLLILVFAVIYAVLSSADFGIFTGKTWLVWVVSLIVAILSVRFLTAEFIALILIPHSTLGVVLSAGIPFVIFAAVVLKLPSGISRKIAWIFFAVVFTGLWIYRLNDLGGLNLFGWQAVDSTSPNTRSVGWVYPLVAFLSLLMAWFDGTIQRYRNKIKGESLQADVNQNLIIDLQKKIAEDAKDYAAGTMRKDSYESRLRKYNQAIASLSK